MILYKFLKFLNFENRFIEKINLLKMDSILKSIFTEYSLVKLIGSYNLIDINKFNNHKSDLYFDLQLQFIKGSKIDNQFNFYFDPSYYLKRINYHYFL